MGQPNGASESKFNAIINTLNLCPKIDDKVSHLTRVSLIRKSKHRSNQQPDLSTADIDRE